MPPSDSSDDEEGEEDKADGAAKPAKPSSSEQPKTAGMSSQRPPGDLLPHACVAARVVSHTSTPPAARQAGIDTLGSPILCVVLGPAATPLSLAHGRPDAAVRLE